MPDFTPRSAVVVIYGGDVLDRIRHLEARADAAADAEDAEARGRAEGDKSPRLASDKPASLLLKEEHDLLVAEAEADAVRVKVQALGRKTWRELVAAHPPRKDTKTDEAVGVNEDTFKQPLVEASIVEPSMSDGERADFLDNIADVDFDRVYFTAFALNRGVSPDPKALLSSQATPLNGATSS